MLEFEYAKALMEIARKENDTLAEARIRTLRIIFQRAWYYQERGMLEKIIAGFVQKKIKMIQQAETKGELQEISKLPKPAYNGNGFTPRKYDTEEEEMLLWRETSLKMVLNQQVWKRYMELFCLLLPEKAKEVFPEMCEDCGVKDKNLQLNKGDCA